MPEKKAQISTVDPASFEAWAVVEIFGHQKFAGKISEFAVGGCNFLRVDVPDLPLRKAKSRFEPDLPATPAFTKLFGNGAIYSITLVSEAVARAVAAQIRPEPERALTAGED